MGKQLGTSWELNLNTGTNASPVYDLMDGVGDVNLSLDIGLGEIALRSLAYVLNLPGKIRGSLEVSLAQDVGETTWDLLRTYFLAGTQKQYAVSNGLIATSGTQGFKFYGIITEFPIDQPLEELVEGSMTLNFGYTEESSVVIPPQWFTI